MPRLPRLAPPGIPQHVVQRGGSGQPVFLAAADYRFFLGALREAAEDSGCSIHAYVLMVNHVHLLATPHHEGSLSRMMQGVGRDYVRHFNRAHRRSGTLWGGRFRATIVEPGRYLLACMRYIELDPVRARLATSPGAYPWSSFRSNAQGVASGLLSPHAVYQGLATTRAARERCYRALFEAELPSGVEQAIRSATRNGEIIGSESYRDHLARQTQRRLRRFAHGGDRKSAAFRGEAAEAETGETTA